MVNALAHHLANPSFNAAPASIPGISSLAGGGGLSSVGAGGARPGIVHRLDRYTSGCIIVAKSDLAHWRLSEDFAQVGRASAAVGGLVVVGCEGWRWRWYCQCCCDILHLRADLLPMWELSAVAVLYCRVWGTGGGGSSVSSRRALCPCGGRCVVVGAGFCQQSPCSTPAPQHMLMLSFCPNSLNPCMRHDSCSLRHQHVVMLGLAVWVMVG